MATTTQFLAKLIIGPGDNNFPSSSVHAVVDNDDLLIEILHRLPVVSIFVFKSVSKRWLSLITSPSFVLRQCQIPDVDPPLGLLFQIENSHLYDYVSLDTKSPSSRNPLGKNFTFGLEGIGCKIFQSCNGLLLCCRFSGSGSTDIICVYNPLLNIFKILPQHHDLSRHDSNLIRMAFDPTKSPHYKVVHVGFLKDLYLQIQTYSSKTGNWSVYGDLFPYRSFTCFWYGVYWNDAIHWISGMQLHSKLNITDRPILTTTKTSHLSNGMKYSNCKLFESRGCLLFAGFLCSQQILNVYEMRNESSGWIVKYLVNLEGIIHPFSKSWMVKSNLWCIVLGKREEGSFMILKLDKEVIEYKIRLETTRKLYDFGQDIPRRCFQLIASFAGV